MAWQQFFAFSFGFFIDAGGRFGYYDDSTTQRHSWAVVCCEILVERIK